MKVNGIDFDFFNHKSPSKSSEAAVESKSSSRPHSLYGLYYDQEEKQPAKPITVDSISDAVPDDDCGKGVYDVIYYEDGVKTCDVDLALSILLKNNTLITKEVKLTDSDNIVVTALYVNCTDTFDSKFPNYLPFSKSDVIELYEFWVKDPLWGADTWSCLKIKRRPQPHIERGMQQSGSWTEELDALPS